MALLLKKSLKEFREDRALRLSAALAYYAIFSLAPLLLIALSVSGRLFGEDAARGALETGLRQHLGPVAAEMVQSMVHSAGKNPDGLRAALIGSVALLFGAAGVFGQLKDALNLIFKVRSKTGGGWARFVADKIKGFGVVLIVGALLLSSVFLTTRVVALTANAGISGTGLLATGFGLGISALVNAGLFAAIFRLLPDMRIPWRSIATGALFTGVLFEAGKFFLAWYLARTATASIFGAATALVLVLMWVYYAAAIFLFGAEFTKVHATAATSELQHTPLAEPMDSADRMKAGLA